MLLKVYPKTPAPRHMSIITEALEKGGIIIVPTDTVYSYACDATNTLALKKMAELKGTNLKQAQFSIALENLNTLGLYTKNVNKEVYRLMNRLLPGPFTFILEASKAISTNTPSRKTIGIRVPDNNITSAIIHNLNRPLATTSVYDDDAIVEYTTDPLEIYQKNQSKVELVIDGGYGNNEPSTIVDCSNSTITIIRKGIGQIDHEEFVV